MTRPGRNVPRFLPPEAARSVPPQLSDSCREIVVSFRIFWWRAVQNATCRSSGNHQLPEAPPPPLEPPPKEPPPPPPPPLDDDDSVIMGIVFVREVWNRQERQSPVMSASPEE